MDKRSIDNISKMHPAVRDKATHLLQEWDKIGLSCTIVSSYRSPLEQTKLYEQGRSSSGAIVTNAKAWDSIHNYGLAFDAYLTADLLKGKLTATPIKCVEIAEALGWIWGGRWNSPIDPPHFQYTGKYKLIDLKTMRKNLDSNGYLLGLEL